MTAPRVFYPDRWLVTTEATHQALHTAWAEQALPDGLHRLRLDQGLVEPVPADQLLDRLRTLARLSPGRVNLLADQGQDIDLPGLMQWAQAPGCALDLHLFRWPRDLPAVLDHLALPDALLLDRLGRRTAPAGALPDAPFALPDGWPAHQRALQAWQAAARQADPEGFDALYGSQAVDWARLLAGPPPAAAAPALGPALVQAWSAAADMLRQLCQPSVLPAAAWAASNPLLQPEERRHPGGHYALTISPAPHEPGVFYLIIDLADDWVAAGQGCEVTVRIGDTAYPLGPVNAQGVVEQRVHGPLPTGQDIEVTFGRLPASPAEGP